jgi:glutamine synthetase
MVDLRAEMVKTLKEVGLETFVVHHEVAQGQGEIGVKFGTLVEAADNVQKLKYVIKMVAHLNGKTATFMPKPLFGDNGNGMHVHQSIWKDGKNLFFEDGTYGNLSETAKHYIGGIFHHAAAVAAITNPSTNSYKRLVPGFEAPSILTFSAKNRSASCRIPFGAGEKAVRIEMRFPDSSSNPYLAFSTLLMAGLDGIKNKYEPVGPIPPFDVKITLNKIDFVIFINRVDGIEKGIYYFSRKENTLTPIHLGDFSETAKFINCVQDLGKDSAFTINMISPKPTKEYEYKLLNFEAGMIGQILYLEAEAKNLRGCGIGCFFDSLITEEILNKDYLALYGFSIGVPKMDERIVKLN